MKEQLISFETAKLAKEKRFCGSFWVENYFHFDGRLSRDVRAETFNEDCHIEASTQSLLQKWLREKHRIIVSVATNALEYHFPMIGFAEVNAFQMKGPTFKVYKTYEEALEAGLFEALKLI